MERYYYEFWIDFGFAVKYASVWANSLDKAKEKIQSKFETEIKRFDVIKVI